MDRRAHPGMRTRFSSYPRSRRAHAASAAHPFPGALGHRRIARVRMRAAACRQRGHHGQPAAPQCPATPPPPIPHLPPDDEDSGRRCQRCYRAPRGEAPARTRTSRRGDSEAGRAPAAGTVPSPAHRGVRRPACAQWATAHRLRAELRCGGFLPGPYPQPQGCLRSTTAAGNDRHDAVVRGDPAERKPPATCPSDRGNKPVCLSTWL